MLLCRSQRALCHQLLRLVEAGVDLRVELQHARLRASDGGGVAGCGGVRLSSPAAAQLLRSFVALFNLSVRVSVVAAIARKVVAVEIDVGFGGSLLRLLRLRLSRRSLLFGGSVPAVRGIALSAGLSTG